MKAYDEIINFFAEGTTPQRVVLFQPSEETRQRVKQLLQSEKQGFLSESEKEEFDGFLQLEHIMRLAKVRDRRYANS